MGHYDAERDAADAEYLAGAMDRKRKRIAKKVEDLKFLIQEYGLEEAIIRYVEYDEA